ncbi:MAG: hypothetical protein PHW01_05080 [Patescibacteria group bacterium]|nr:hypothetical protein [Patescibacteria group bacterium]
MTELKTLKFISEKFNLKESYLKQLIKSDLLDYTLGKDKRYLIPTYQYPRLNLLSSNKEYQKEILSGPKHFLYEYHPELEGYLSYHDIVDRFAWMLKMRFADREMMKSRRYKIDTLYQLFIKDLDYNHLKFKNVLVGKNFSETKFKFHLMQGWYNEIAGGYPFSQDFNIGSSLDYIDDDAGISLFPSWKIIKYYYSIYSYFTSFVFTENPSLKTEEHRKSSIYFNRHQLSKYSKIILKFPFNICYKKGLIKKSFLDINKREWRFKYAQCPRGNKNIYQLENEYRNDLKRTFFSKANNKDIFTILDILYKFRVWSNYQGIETLAKLKQGGLLLFLERNLYTICFFTAGIAELVAISFLGEKKFKKIFESFYLEYIKENDLLYEKWHRIPQVIRYRIYSHLNILKDLPKGFIPPNKDELELV